jgi:hypothetical protein
MRPGVPCNENRVFPVGIDLQGVPCKLYRVWVCSAFNYLLTCDLKSKFRHFEKATQFRKNEKYFQSFLAFFQSAKDIIPHFVLRKNIIDFLTSHPFLLILDKVREASCHL